jgi:actin-related protein
MYEGMVVDTAVRTSSLGGRDLTEFMSDMLLSRKNEVFSTLVPRKQLEAARRLKERHCYVALDFDKEVRRQGAGQRLCRLQLW